MKRLVEPAGGAVRDSESSVDYGVALLVFTREARRKEAVVYFLGG